MPIWSNASFELYQRNSSVTTSSQSQVWGEWTLVSEEASLQNGWLVNGLSGLDVAEYQFKAVAVYTQINGE